MGMSTNMASVRMLTLAYQGDYVIPTGAIVIGNHWFGFFHCHLACADTCPRTVARDPDVFPDPEEFRPNRWLDESGKLREDITSFNFGFGRRCADLNTRSDFALTLNVGYVLDNMWRTSEPKCLWSS